MDIPEDEMADYETFLLRTKKTLEAIEAIEGRTKISFAFPMCIFD